MTGDRFRVASVAVAGAAAVCTGCSMTGAQTAPVAQDAGRPPSDITGYRGAGDLGFAGDTSRRAQIAADVADIVGALGLRAEPTTNASLFGRVSLSWTSEEEDGGFIDIARPQVGPELPVQGLARFAPWRVELAAAEAAIAQTRRGDELRVDYVMPFSTNTGGGFALDVEPRATVVAGDALSGATAGAIVRFGRNLSAPRKRSDEQGWHVFVGADAQALTLKLDRTMPMNRSLRVEDFQMLGDAQAGVAMRVWGGDLAFGLIQRELKYEDARVQEHFGGVTYKVTW